MVAWPWVRIGALRGARLAAVALGGALASGSLPGCGGPPGAPDALPEQVAFNRDVRPILSDKCYACHGPDPRPREAELRLDRREVAVAPREGGPAIAPGDPAGSQLVRRIRSEDPGERMPPPESRRSLSAREIAILERWVEQGAEYQPHWSYRPLRRPSLPEVGDAAWAANPVDRFVRAGLERRGLAPSPPADPVTLVRRLHQDLLGLPPEPDVVRAFAADPSDVAWERLVDRVLASPHYGERMAVHWLDLVRYADSNGYHVDDHRSVHPYRDYVIDAFNDNVPFDRFTVEQLAGDLLPDATLEQRVASGYNRLNRVTTENGAQAREYLAKYAADRVRTTASVWLGSTLGCAECHDHKFDPFSARDFYSFAAFFADLEEKGYYTTASTSLPPEERVPRPADEEALGRIDARIAALRAERAEQAAVLGEALRQEEARWRQSLEPPGYAVLEPRRASARGGTALEILPDGSIRAGAPAAQREVFEIEVPAPAAGVRAFRIDALPDPSLPASGPGFGPDGSYTLSELVVREAADGEPLEWRRASASADGAGGPDGRPEWAVARAIDGRRSATAAGWSPPAPAGRADHAVFEATRPVAAGDGALHLALHHSAGGGRTLGRFQISVRTPDAEAEARPARAFSRREWDALGPGGRREGDAFRLRTGLGRKVDGVRRRLRPKSGSFDLDLGLGRFRLNTPQDTIVWAVKQAGARESLHINLLLHDNALLLEAQAADADLRPGVRALQAAARRLARLPVPEQIESLRIKLRWTGYQSAWRIFYGIDGEPAVTEVEGGPIVLPWPPPIRLNTQVLVTRQKGVGAAYATLTEFGLRPYRPRFDDLPADVARALEVPPAARRPEQERRVSEFFLRIAPGLEGLNRQLDALEVRRARVEENVPTTLVSRATEPRTVRVLPRGDWMDPSGEVVEPAVPTFLPPLPGDGPADRLALGRWLASAENPLTARAAANRWFQLAFGRGLAQPLDDLGAQGAWPSHPELLDWLAAEFVESGWDVKHTLGLLVRSRAYRQSSRPRPELAERDPENAWLARQNRFRLDAEFVRDAALAVSGLLAPRIGGPSVKPYQPPDYWRDVVVSLIETPGTVWTPSNGPNQHRRGLYTYWKRSFPHPSLLAFDAPSREECVARRARTNTPLQALVLLNDPTYVEAARVLAERALREGGEGFEERLAWAYRRTLSRDPGPRVRERLAELHRGLQDAYQGRRRDARRLAGVGLRPRADDLDPVELAAFTGVARALLNQGGMVYRY